MKLKDIFENPNNDTDEREGTLSIEHLDIDPSTVVHLIHNGDIIETDTLDKILTFLQDTEMTGNFIISQNGVELLSVNL